MTFKEALGAMKNGEKVRRKPWNSETFIAIDGKIKDYEVLLPYDAFVTYHDNFVYEYKLSYKDLMATDWAIFEDKKEEKTKENLPVFELDYGKTTESECIVRTSSGKEYEATYVLNDVHFFGEGCKQRVFNVHVVLK